MKIEKQEVAREPVKTLLIISQQQFNRVAQQVLSKNLHTPLKETLQENN